MYARVLTSSAVAALVLVVLTACVGQTPVTTATGSPTAAAQQATPTPAPTTAAPTATVAPATTVAPMAAPAATTSAPTATPTPAPTATPTAAPQLTAAPSPSPSQPYSLSGRVTAADGAPLGVSVIVVTDLGRPGFGGFRDTVTYTTTDATGRYVAPVPAGTYRVKFVLTRGPGSVERWWRDAVDKLRATDVVVTSASVSGIDMVFPPIVNVTGKATSKATGSGLQNVSVYATLLPNLNSYASTRTDATGRYELPIFAGTHQVQFNYGGSGASVTHYWKDTPCPSSADGLVVGATGVTGIDVALPPLFSVSGKVTNRTTGAPFPNLTILAVLASSTSSCTVGAAFTDASGSYRLLLPEGTYRVRAPGTVFNQERWWKDAASQETADPVAVTSDLSGIDVSVAPATR